MSRDFNIDTYLPGQIVCVGMNYRSHAKEQDGRFPDKPVLFSKAMGCIIKNNENIICPHEVKELDYEVELAVIVDKEMHNVPVEKVEDHIYGYTIINDVTARDIQRNESQWYRAKSFDTFCPIGPVIVPRWKIIDPNNLFIRSCVNGELRQDSNTGDMLLDVYQLLAYISSSITIYEGDLIATGTPAGVGVFMSKKSFLKDGDEVVCEIENIGQLTNKIVYL